MSSGAAGCRRQFVAGPQDPESEELARTVAALLPEPGSVPHAACESLGPVLITHAEDADALGTTPEGIPVAMALGAASVLSVPLSDGERGYRRPDPVPAGQRRAFRDGRRRRRRGGRRAARAGDPGLPGVPAAQRGRGGAAGHLAAARAAPVPGVEVAVAHVAAASGPEVGGEFYDIDPGGAVWPSGMSAVPAGRGHHRLRRPVRAARGERRPRPGPEAMLRAANDVLIGRTWPGSSSPRTWPGWTGGAPGCG